MGCSTVPVVCVGTYLGNNVSERVKHRTIITTSVCFFTGERGKGLDDRLRDKRRDLFYKTR